MEHSLTLMIVDNGKANCLNPYSNGKNEYTKSKSGRHLNLLANVGIISGKRKICAKIVHGGCYLQNFH